MANILKQIKVGNTTYNIEPYTNYLPLTGGILTGKLYINAPLNNPGSSDPSLAINYSTSAQTISDANLNMIKFGSLDNYIGEAPASRTIEGIPAFAFHTTMGNNSEFAWLSAGWDHRMSLGKGGLTLHKGKLTLSDDIVYKGAKSSGSIIKFMNNTADIYGNGIRIGGGGATIIGGGESADLPSVSGGDEVLYLMNDGNIDFYSNCQDGLSSAKHMSFDTAGTLNVPTNVVGSSSSNRLIFRHLDGQNCNGDYNLYLQYHQQNSRIYLNGSTYYIENGSYYNGTAASAGNADTVDGDHSSAFARVASHNDLTASGNEFTFASSGYSGPIYLNWRTAGGTNGNITEYILGNGAGASLGTIIHTGNIGSQNVNYANSAGSVAWGNVSDKPDLTDKTYVDTQLGNVRNSISGLGSALNNKADKGHTHSYLPLSGGSMTGTINLASSSNGIQFNSSSYYVTNMESGSVDVTLGYALGNETSKTVSFHGGSKGSGTWHIVAQADGVLSDNVSIGVTSISNTGFTIWVKNVLAGSSSRTLRLHYIAVKYY